MNNKEKNDLRNRDKRIFFLYKFYLLDLDKKEIDKELHENIDEFNFTILQQDTIKKIINNINSLEEKVKKLLLNWKWERINVLDKAALINGAAEITLFKNKKSIVINETIIFCKNYCEIDSYKYINAILDKIEKNNNQ